MDLPHCGCPIPDGEERGFVYQLVKVDVGVCAQQFDFKHKRFVKGFFEFEFDHVKADA
ncbi:hypothetical protein CUZ56_03037 [Saezia sanguinis]|uniref:Uncharacterized protein n=1 Tax=Saezia sanguinis TaxID=1965230 RepID=A0A433S9F0_9BURK|nr:hypothetical protein CUZ56_03037 [Saezia sanguinis]